QTARSVSFTSSAVRKSRATSGSRTTTLVLSAYLAACLPLMPLLKSYSGRRMSLSSGRLPLVCFFIVLPFRARGASGADDANFVFPLCVRYHEHGQATDRARRGFCGTPRARPSVRR